MGQPGGMEAAVNNQKFQDDDQQAAHQPQFLAAHGENKVRLPRREPRAGLGLYPVEQALAEQPAAAQGHHAAGLLPGNGLIVAVVEDHQDAVEPVGGQLVKQRQPADPQGQYAEARGEPVPGQPRCQGHGRVDDQIDQAAARVVGDHINPQEHEGRVARREHQGAQPPHAPPLPEPGNLFGQQDGIGQLDHLRRLDAHGQPAEVQPGPVAGAVVYAERQQQRDKAQIENQKEGPFFRKMLHVCVGKYKIRGKSQQRAHSLEYDPAHLELGPAVVGGAGNQHNAERCGYQAQRQQDHVRFSENVLSCFPQPDKDAHNVASRQKFSASLPHKCGAVNYARSKKM